MKKILVKQIKSSIKKSKNQKLTLEALGLGKINKEVEHTATPQIVGMVNTVKHIVNVQEIK
ncbi:MAG: 50S ribosomal protein L30 [Flavobacteriales bacterium]|nr:50S ribosomal protein L30 [Flavobacteriales bacterium]